MSTKFDYVMVDKDNLVGYKETDWLEKAYKDGDIFSKCDQLFVYINGEYKKASVGDLIVFNKGKLELIKSDYLYKMFGKKRKTNLEERPDYCRKKEEPVNNSDIYSVIFLERNGSYTSIYDTTWFEEELKKQDRIKYNKDVDTYTITECTGTKIVEPGDLIIKCYDKLLVFDSWSVLVHMLMFYKDDIFSVNADFKEGQNA